MNKFSKYVVTALLTGAFTVSAPLSTYSPVANASGSGAPTMEQEKQQQQTDLGSENIMAVSRYQNSVEAKALYLQGYNSAKVQLDKEIKKNDGKEKLAIALDLDETVLDNSPYQGYATLNNKEHPEGWHEWIEAAKAKPVYGAKSFLEYADKKGVDIYYITDRDEDKDFEATKRNLKEQGIPQATDDHMMLKGKDDKSKEPRRKQVEKDHKLVMLFGDNILDFGDPEKPTAKEREKFIQEHKDDFGKKYIIFPNPMYGSFEATLYNNNYDISDEEKDQLRKQSIKQFNPSTGEVE